MTTPIKKGPSMPSVDPSARIAVSHSIPAQVSGSSEGPTSVEAERPMEIPGPPSVQLHVGAPLALTSLPGEALSTAADDLSTVDRAALAVTSKQIHSTVVEFAADPVTNGVYQAQAHFKRLQARGASETELKPARDAVKAAVALAVKRQAVQRRADAIGQLGVDEACIELRCLGQYSKALNMLINDVWAKGGTPDRGNRVVMALLHTLMGDYTTARAIYNKIPIERPETAWAVRGFLARIAVLEGNFDSVEGEIPPNSGDFGTYAAVAEMRARKADSEGDAASAREHRAKVRELIGRAEARQDSMSVLVFHAVTGGARAAFAYMNANRDKFEAMHFNDYAGLVPRLIGPSVIDEAARQDWIGYLGAKFQLPEQLATIRFPDDARTRAPSLKRA